MKICRLFPLLGLLLAQTLPMRAEVTLAGTAWYNGSTGAISPNPSEAGHWVPSNQGNITGIVFSPADRNVFGANSGTVFLQNFILPNSPATGGSAAFATIIDLTTNLVVGSSLNSVASTQNSSLTTATPYRFDSLQLSTSGSYALVFTSTAGVAGTAVSGMPASVGLQLAAGTDLDPSAGTLLVSTARWGGVVNPAADLMQNTGVYTPGVPSPGQFVNYDQWYTATFTSTEQHLTALNAAPAQTVIQPAAFTDAQGFRKTGAGTYVLNQSNTSTGDVIIEEGVLRLDFTAVGTSSSRVGGTGVTIMLNNYGAQSQSSNQFAGATLEVAYNGGGGGVVLVDNNIEGVGILLKTGAGQASLTGTNTFTGTLRISNGTMALDSLGSENGEMHVEITSAAASLALGQTFNGNTATIASLSGIGNVRANFGANAGLKTLEIRQNINTEFSGVIENNGTRNIAIIKSGTGVLKFSGNNVYQGTTKINGGTLVVNGNQSTAVGAVTVNSSGTLAGVGSLGGATTVASGGRLAAGDPTVVNTIGTLTLGAGLTLQTGSTTVFELSGATGNAGDASNIPASLLNGTPGNHDHLEIIGSLSLAAGSVIQVELKGYTATWGDVFNLADWSAAGNAVANGFDPTTDFDFSGAQLADGWHWETDLFLSQGIIYVTPEPSRVLLLLAGLVTLGLRRRR